jgi:hypothetical protein
MRRAWLRSFVAVASLGAAAAHAEFPQPFDVGVTYSRELFVATDGSDSSGTGSSDRPYATIARALAEARPGTRVRVRAGTYGPVGTTRNLQGTAEAPIAVVADGAVTIDAGRVDAAAWHIGDPRYLVIQGFTIENSAIHGINIDDGGDTSPAEHIVLRGLHFRDIGTGGNHDCLKLSGVDRFYVSESEFEDCDEGEAIDMVGCHDGVVTGNYFHDIPRNAVGTKGGSADVLVHGNRFVDIAQRAVNAGGATGTDYFRPLNAAHEASRIRIVANVFERAGPPVAFAGCDSCLFAHNTVVEPRRWLARIVEENTNRSAGHSGQIVNNVIVFNSRRMDRIYVDVGDNARPETFTIGSNVWYAIDNPRFRLPRLAPGLPSETGSLLQIDPLLVDRRNGDLRLRSGSPAIGSARELPAVFDYDRRPYSAPPTIGAFDIGATRQP